MKIRQSLNRRGVGAYLALAFTVLSILLTVILVEVIGVTATRVARSNIGSSLAELAWQNSDKLDRGMYERYREVQLMAKRRDLVSLQTSIEDKRQTLDDRQQTYQYYAWIGLTDTSGKVLVANGGLLEGANVSGRPWFRNALQGIHVGDVHEAVLLAKLLPSNNGEPKRFVDVAFPYADSDGKMLGVLGVHLSWEWARDVERSIIERTLADRRVQSLIVGADGSVLLGPADVQGQKLSLPSLGEARSRGKGSVVERWPDGREYLVGYSQSKGYESYPGLGWTVLVRQSVDEAYAPVRKIQRRVLWSGIALAVLFSALGLAAARRISLPLRELADAARQIGNGEAVALPRRATYSEVEVLSSSLNALLASLLQKESDLKELNQTLETRVAQRTSELEQALASVRASERRIRTIIDTAQDAYVGVDLNGLVTDWNDQAERMFGWPRAEAIGQPLAALVLPQRFGTSVENFIAAVRDGSAPVLNHRLERIVVNRAGDAFPVEVTVGLAGSGDASFFSAFLHDISERKKVERMKNDFISTVSHELRTPLTSIRASLSLLASGIAGDLPDDARGLVDISHQSCERLVRLVGDVLDTEKMESGNMEFHIQRQPLMPLAEQAIDAIAGYAGQYNVNVKLESGQPDLQAPVDRDRIIQVLDNLLSNAIKFSPPGATVRLALSADAGRVRLSVTDQGSGIPPSFHDRIFQKFAQADSTDTRRKGGTGLGLSICKSIVEQHGGSIGFESQPGHTVFRVELPA